VSCSDDLASTSYTWVQLLASVFDNDIDFDLQLDPPLDCPALPGPNESHSHIAARDLVGFFFRTVLSPLPSFSPDLAVLPLSPHVQAISVNAKRCFCMIGVHHLPRSLPI